MTSQSNILLIHCHDLGQQLSCYGADVMTPNIDELAADGQLFENAFCSAPQCSPSRGSIMTGCHPQQHGLMGLAHWNWSLNENEKTLPMYLADAGYDTHLFGFQHEVATADIERLGYDSTWIESERALDLADRFDAFCQKRTADEPFFASVGFVEPHREFVRDYVPEEAYERYDSESVSVPEYLPDRPGIRTDMASLNALITATVDKAVGRIRQTLEAIDILEETMVIFTTDHGIALPRAKGTCYDPGIETGLIISQPGRFESGAIHNEMLSNVDLLPTILESVSGVDVPTSICGRSFLPLLDGRSHSYEPRKAIYAGMTWHDGYNPIRCVRTEDYKYIRNFWVLPEVFLPGDIYGTAAGREVRDEYYLNFRPVEELYDLTSDPFEQENLASDRAIFQDPAMNESSGPDSEYADLVSTYRNHLRSWMEDIDDPLLDGPVPHPTYAEF